MEECGRFKNRIRREARLISQIIIESVYREFIWNFEYCQIVNGAHLLNFNNHYISTCFVKLLLEQILIKSVPFSTLVRVKKSYFKWYNKKWGSPLRKYHNFKKYGSKKLKGSSQSDIKKEFFDKSE